MVLVMGIGGAAKAGSLAGGAHGELVEVGFAQQNGVLVLQQLPDGRVVDGRVALQNFGAAGGFDALGGDVVFERHGDACKRVQRLAAGNFFIDHSGGLQCLLGRDIDIGIERAVVLLNGGKVLLRQLCAGDLLLGKLLADGFDMTEICFHERCAFLKKD